MKIKSFGLIEAMIASCIIIIFITGISLLSVRFAVSNLNLNSNEVNSRISREFFHNIDLLNLSEKISYDNNYSDSTKLPVECFDFKKALKCKNFIMDAYPLNQFPYLEMTKFELEDGYYKIKDDYFGNFKNENNYRIKASVREGREDKSFYVDLEIAYEDLKKERKFLISRYFTGWPSAL